MAQIDPMPTTQNHPISLVDAITQKQQRIAAGDLEHLVDDPTSPDHTHPLPENMFDTFDKLSLGEKNTGDSVFFNLPAGALDLDMSSLLSFESGMETSTVLPNPVMSEETWL